MNLQKTVMQNSEKLVCLPSNFCEKTQEKIFRFSIDYFASLIYNIT